MIDPKTRRSLTSSFGAHGTVALAVVLFAPFALTAAGVFYYTLALSASASGGFSLWGMFRLSVHDIEPESVYQFLGLHLIAREYLYQSLFFVFFAVITSIGAANHWLLRIRDRRIAAFLKEHGLL